MFPSLFTGFSYFQRTSESHVFPSRCKRNHSLGHSLELPQSTSRRLFLYHNYLFSSFKLFLQLLKIFRSLLRNLRTSNKAILSPLLSR